MSIALISSLYRCEQHLPTFTAALFGFAKRISQSGISVHYLPIINDPSPYEREQINQLTREINAHYYGRMTPYFVPRESLYASWNRGLSLSRTAHFAPWNADDIRSSEAFIEGYRLLQNGASLVDFPFTRTSSVRRLGLFTRQQRAHAPLLYNPEAFTRRNGLGPFFMASRALYDSVGPFDEHFRVAGDMEWAGRAQAHARFQDGQMLGGDFIIHGGNLSNSGGEREAIEVNTIFMRRGEWRHLRPAHPQAQKEAWQSWGNPNGIPLPAEVEDFLWGPSSHERWRQYHREGQQGPLRRRIRLALAARGLIHSAEWSVYQQRRESE